MRKGGCSHFSAAWCVEGVFRVQSSDGPAFRNVAANGVNNVFRTAFLKDAELKTSKKIANSAEVREQKHTTS